MTSEEFYKLGFRTQLQLIIKKGKYLYTEGDKNELHDFYTFKQFTIDHRKWPGTNEATIQILEVKPARKVMQQVDKMQELAKSLTAFRKLSALEQKKLLNEMRQGKR